ncbi:nitroreductase family protein [Pseudomonas sp. 5P_3.1_Bac2]|uniref:nitroreductase family protein n=1 Tax=Pseudomonas sp. 5P_3.1_Bac2 TaxID=2971617 RepID=UPI0021C9AAE2|nr:nitroreductase family protein [Pseudomonas sp. 5P_3.1_Bac2]MCU1716511.1 nitroreductase family protein [Pseudomonas sp. 5P_3.1_Bac2]
MDALDALLNRVSVPRLVAPAPTAEQRQVLFQAALRAPDHGQLRPWRFLTVEGAALNQLGEVFARALPADASPELLTKTRNMPLRAPLLVVVIATLSEHPKVPASEQLLAAGCAAHGILLAAHAQGIGAVWRTGELSYNRQVAAGLGLAENENIVAYLYLGTAERALRDAPKLEVSDFVQSWSQPA